MCTTPAITGTPTGSNTRAHAYEFDGVADGRYVYHTDALGSVVAMTDDLQSMVQSYSYEAFGRLRSATGPGPVGGNLFTYTAREPLGDTQSFYYYRWRVLDPNVGRFTSEDPLGFVDRANVYVYVANRPIISKDPKGLSPISSFYSAMVLGDTGETYIDLEGKKFHRGCLVNACKNMVNCMLNAAGSGAVNVAVCGAACLVTLLGGPISYGACFAACTAADALATMINVNSCWESYNAEKAGCECSS